MTLVYHFYEEVNSITYHVHIHDRLELHQCFCFNFGPSIRNMLIDMWAGKSTDKEVELPAVLNNRAHITGKQSYC